MTDLNLAYNLVCASAISIESADSKLTFRAHQTDTESRSLVVESACGFKCFLSRVMDCSDASASRHPAVRSHRTLERNAQLDANSGHIARMVI